MRSVRASTFVFFMVAAEFLPGFTQGLADDLLEDTNKITSLTVEQAKRLVAEVKVQGLSLNGLATLDAKTAKALAESRGSSLSLNGLTTLDADTAKALAGFKGNMLALQGLTSLDTDSAKALAGFRGRYLLLDGLRTLDALAAEALAEHGGCISVRVQDKFFASNPLTPKTAKAWAWLSDGNLSDVTALDSPAAVEIVGILASRKGQVQLSLPKLKRVSPEVAKALADFKGTSLRLHGLTTLSEEAAEILAANEKWDGQLPLVTVLDVPESVAIAKALAARKGPLSLPNLKKISPKALTALLKKEDVEIPMIETLELIQEPDGSVTEDFIIPERRNAR
jgi:hypothetical protein